MKIDCFGLNKPGNANELGSRIQFGSITLQPKWPEDEKSISYSDGSQLQWTFSSCLSLGLHMTTVVKGSHQKILPWLIGQVPNLFGSLEPIKHFPQGQVT